LWRKEGSVRPSANITDLKLLAEVESDIIYDCHGFSAKIGRSRARRTLLENGRKAFASIAFWLRNKGKPDDTNENNLNFHVYISMLMLIDEIRKVEGLPATPYEDGTSYANMETKPWIKYCNRHAA
jgi:hypothetical protein